MSKSSIQKSKFGKRLVRKILSVTGNKPKIFFIILSITLLIAISFAIYSSVKPKPNDDIFFLGTGNSSILGNTNPTFNINFGKREEPDSQWVRFEAKGSSQNPFEEKKENLFTRLINIVKPKKEYGIEMSLQGVKLSETEELEIVDSNEKIKTVADIIGTDDVKTSTELIESGRVIGEYSEEPVSKKTVLNKNVADGVDIEYQILEGLGLKEEIIIRNLEEYTKDCNGNISECKLPLNEFIFDLKLDEGLELKKGWFTLGGKSTESYYFEDGDGNYVAHFLPNWAVDSEGDKTYDVVLNVEEKEVGNYRAKVTVDINWLFSSDRVYPVRIDPSIVHDTKVQFDNGIFERTESVDGPRVQLETSEEFSSGEYISPAIDLSTTSTITDLSWTEVGTETGGGETPYSTTGLIAQWDFNETSGTAAVSGGSCSTTCNGTLNNMTTTGQDVAVSTGWTNNNRQWGDGALMFDGSNDYVSVPSSLDTPIKTGSFTIAGWANVDDVSSSEFVIMTRGQVLTGGVYYGVSFQIQSTGLVFARDVGTTTSYSTSYSFTPEINRWYYVAVTYNDSTGGVVLYLDGKEVGSGTFSTNDVGYHASYDLGYTIGAKRRNISDRYSNGTIDTVSVYSRILSSTEILSNYQAGNIEFQYRKSSNGINWSSWYGGTEVDIEGMDEGSDNWSLGEAPSPLSIGFGGQVDVGTGADGACVVSANTDINTGSCVGRGVGDAVNFSVTSNVSAGATSVTLSSSPTGLAIGDEILIINLQGSTSSYSDVGEYDTAYITDINTNTLSLDRGLVNGYDGTTQKIMVQRIPQYTDVTVNTSINWYPSSWNGTKGGVLAFRATGSVTVTGTIHANGLGYRQGAAGTRTGYKGGGGGEAFCGVNNIAGGVGGDGVATSVAGQAGACGGGGGSGADDSTVAAGGLGSGSLGGAGGGGGSTEDGTSDAYNRGGGGGGGGYGTFGYLGEAVDGSCDGQNGEPRSSGNGGRSYAPTSTNHSGGGGGGGGTYGDTNLDRLFFGSGGGGGGQGEAYGYAGAGGNGGGIVFISANSVSVSGGISSNGSNGGNGTGSNYDDGGGGGGGAGGSIKIIGNTVDVGTNKTIASGGTGGAAGEATGGTNKGGNGGNGRIAVHYLSLSGSITTTAYYRKILQENNQIGTGDEGVLELSAVRLPKVDSATMAYWKLDEETGTGAYLLDSSSNVNHITPSGSSYTAGQLDGARSLNGTSDYLSLPTGFSDFTSGLTIEFWAYPTNTASWSRFFDLGLGQANNNILIARNGTTSNLTYQVYSGSTGGTQITVSGIITNDKWNHYAVTETSTGAVIIYKNGVQVGSGTTTIPVNISRTSNYIGKSNWSVDGYYGGIIDDVRISNIARTSEEIVESYEFNKDYYINRVLNTGVDLTNKTMIPFYVASDTLGSNIEFVYGNTLYSNYQSDANTVGLWHLGELGSTTSLMDSSSYGSNGTPTGTAYTADGKMGGARDFAAGTDRVTVANSRALNITTSITIEAWINPDSMDSTGSWNRIVEKGENNQYSLSLSSQSGYGLIARFYGTSAVTIYSYTIPPLGKWSHVAVTYNGSTVKFYLNGFLVSSTATTGAISTTTGALNIGNVVSATRGFDGKIDEVRISKVARTANEIREAYSIGKRTHQVKVNFKADLQSSNLITGSSDTSFTISETDYGTTDEIENLNIEDRIIVKEISNGTLYMAQGTVDSVDVDTGAVTVSSWNTGSTFPTGGYTVDTVVFKWQKEFIDIRDVLPEHRNAVSFLSFKLANQIDTNYWIDDIKGAEYLTPTTVQNETFTPTKYFQYKAIFTTQDVDVTPYISAVQIDYTAGVLEGGPTMDLIMRHGKWFGSGGKQNFWWVNPQ